MKKRLLLIMGIIGMFSLLGGISYAYFNYYKEGGNSVLISGDIYLNLNSGLDSINLDNALPESKIDARSRNNNKLTFTVTGKNTSNKDIMYSIELNNGGDIDGKQRLDAEDLLFDLVEINGNTRTYLINALGYDEFNHTKIWDEIIRANTNSGTSHTYELRMWINENVTYGEGVGVKYSIDEFINSYASVKIAVTGDTVTDEYYKVTFDGQGGDVKRAYYYTRLGDNYDNLYTPEKEGYKFLGWNGKNKFNVGTEDDYYANEGVNISIESNINSISGIVRKDAVSYYRNNNNKYNSGIYALSKQGFARHLIYAYDSEGNSLNNANVTIDGWTYNSYYNAWFKDSRITTVTIPQNVSYWKYGSVFIGATVGERAIHYDIQLEEGSVATPYEPYYVTSDTEVTEWNTPMALTAKYDKIPEIELSQQDYIEKDLTTWIGTDTTINNGVVTLNNTSSTLESGYIPVYGEFWYITFDAYTENVASGKDYGAFVTNNYFYDGNFSLIELGSNTACPGAYNCGAAAPLTLNEWNIGVMYSKTIEAVKNRNYYGENMKYVKIVFRYDIRYSSIPYSLKNAKIHFPESGLIKVNVTDDGEIALIKYAKGNHNVEYFENNGTNALGLGDYIVVSENGTYTVYVRDSIGNEVVKTIEITGIE